jgi:hypothetical protein
LNFLLLQLLARLTVHSRKTLPYPHNLSRPACRCLEVHKVCVFTLQLRASMLNSSHQRALCGDTAPILPCALRHTPRPRICTYRRTSYPTEYICLLAVQELFSRDSQSTRQAGLAIFQHAFSGPGTHCPACACPRHDSFDVCPFPNIDHARF